MIEVIEEVVAGQWRESNRAGLSYFLVTAVKVAMDRIGSLVLLVVLSPLWLALVALIRITSEGPALFRQLRVGLHGVEYRCLKFRTMVPGARIYARDSWSATSTTASCSRSVTTRGSHRSAGSCGAIPPMSCRNC